MARRERRQVKGARSAAPPKRARVSAAPAHVDRPKRGWGDERTRFTIAFAVIAASLLALYYSPRTDKDVIERWTAGYLRLYTHLVAWPIRLFDPHVSARGNLLAGRFSMQIVKSCDAMEVNILFASAILAFSGPWRRKLVALVLGLAALACLNIVRLFVLYWVGVFAPSAFDFLHLDVWPLFMVAFAAIDFIVSVRWVRGRAIAIEAHEGVGAPAA